MECDNKVITKTLVVSCRKYSLFGFRFGPFVTLKIEVVYHSCGKFSASIVDGPMVKKFEIIFKEELTETRKQIVKDLTLAVRRKNISKSYKEKQTQKIYSETIIKDLNRTAFDELTTRMKKNREQRNHPCLIKKPNVVIKDEEVQSFENYFGDTSKIINRKTRKD